jgi:hypothetical protein
MESTTILVGLAVAAVPGAILLRFILPKIPLVSCHCKNTSGLWEPEVHDYGLSLTEDNAEKRLRVGRVQGRLRASRQRLS